MMKQLIILSILIVFFPAWSFGQEQDTLNFLEAIEEDGDTLPHLELDAVPVFPRPKFESRKQERRYFRLERKVKKVYPYAQKAAQLLKKYEDEYLAAETEKERKKYIKQVERELFNQYGDELKKLSISEGRILIKLIDRETGHTSYELIKDLKGGLVAFFWQGVARIFGNDLKDEYDPVIEDILIEQIIIRIEAGVI